MSRTVRYSGTGEVAHWCGVSPETVTKWLIRYDDWPDPDAEITPGRHGTPDRGWLPERRDEWLGWMAARPGRGAHGKSRQTAATAEG